MRLFLALGAFVFTFWKVIVAVIAFLTMFGFLTSTVTPGIGEGKALHTGSDGDIASESN